MMLLYLYNFLCETQVVVGVYWESHKAAINSTRLDLYV